MGRGSTPAAAAAAGDEELENWEWSLEVAYNAASPNMWFNFVLNHPNPLLNIRFHWLALFVEFLSSSMKEEQNYKGQQ